ncbi:hypothetical protein [Hydrocarboniphaga effusa]|uniref:hypothetical protein n=1 Tax=Hydrocarboniphaga effusa TaxID=243629 RepID=UPI00398BD884
MYQLIDTFNDRTISQHRSIEAAARADLAHGRRIKRVHGSSSYIPTAIRKDGERLSDEEADYLNECLERLR